MAKIVFMGTPDFALPTLRALLRHHEVIGVVTQPDRPVGRTQKIVPSPVKQLAQEAGIPVFQPEKVRHPAVIEQLRQLPAEVYVVAAFGQILPQAVLDIPAHGSINVHASLLPRWRGAAPIPAAIRAGDPETGVTIMKMDAGLDTGPILSQGTLPIAPDETGQTLHDKLASLGADLLIHTLPGYLTGAIQPKPQPEQGVTTAPQIRKEDGNIDWSQDASSIERTVRAFTPWPGTYSYWQGQRLKIHAGYVMEGDMDPGSVALVNNHPAIGTGNGLFCPVNIQLAGKKAMTIEEFVRGHPDFVGSTLGNGAV